MEFDHYAPGPFICVKLAELRTKIENCPQPQVRNLNNQSPQASMSATFFVSSQLRICGLAQLCEKDLTTHALLVKI